MKHLIYCLAVLLLAACGSGSGSSGGSSTSTNPNVPPTDNLTCQEESHLSCLAGVYPLRQSYLSNTVAWSQLHIQEDGAFVFVGHSELDFLAEQIIAVEKSIGVIHLRVQFTDHEKSFYLYTADNHQTLLDLEWSQLGQDYGALLSVLPDWQRTPAGQVGNGVSGTVNGVLYPIYKEADDVESFATDAGLYLTVANENAQWRIRINQALAAESYSCAADVSIEFQLGSDSYLSADNECRIDIVSYELLANGEIDYIDARFVAQLKPAAGEGRWLRINDGIFRFDVN